MTLIKISFISDITGNYKSKRCTASKMIYKSAKKKTTYPTKSNNKLGKT